MADEHKGGSAPWLEMLKDAETADRRYHDLCDNIDDLYSDLEKLAAVRKDRQFQIYWANLQVLMPTVYSRPPVPVVTSRFRDRKPLPRRTGDILERSLVSDVEADDLHETLLLIRDDLCANARGVPWLRITVRDGVEVPSARHVDRKDFRCDPARKWSEVDWVARRAWMTREEARERFDEVPPEMTFREKPFGDERKGEKKAPVWELWHKEKKTVVWVTEGVEDVLDQQDPWMDLTGFFPCPRPAYGTLKRGTLTPVPDFVYYRDQVEEINEITARISALAESLRLRGFYPAGNADVGDAIETALKSRDNNAVLVPVASMAALGTGSLKDAIIWLPVREVAEVIVQLIALRRQLIEDVYEITGISDIMRGSTEAQETLGAQELKSQYGSVRVQSRQAEMIRIARDIIRMKAEIMAENVPIADLLTMAQIDDLPSAAELAEQAKPIIAQVQQQLQALLQQPDQQAAQQQAQQIEQAAQQQLEQLQQTITQEQVEELLKSQKTRPFVLEVETDSTIQPDEMQKKQSVTEFMGAVGPLLQQAVTAMQLAPQLGPFVAEALRFATAPFRPGRQMEDAIDELSEGFAQYQPPAQPGEDPQAAQAMAQAEVMKAEAAGKAAEAKGQEAIGKVEIMRQQMEIDAATSKSELGLKEQEAGLEAQKTGTEIEKIRADIQLIMAKIGQTQVQAQVAERGAVVAERTAEAGISKTEADISATEKQGEIAEQTAKVGIDKTKADIGRIGAQSKAIGAKPKEKP